VTLPASYAEPAAAARITLIAQSFERLLGRPLVESRDDTVAAMWAAPQAIVAHGIEPDPLFFFANRSALARFESDLARFIGMPSRLSAEAPLRDERQAFLDAVAQRGFVEGYSGVRISASGRRFTIRGGIVWNLVDAGGTIRGQAATFEV
jgi:hypothetical protein